jgi:hypothetical protein
MAKRKPKAEAAAPVEPVEKKKAPSKPKKSEEPVLAPVALFPAEPVVEHVLVPLDPPRTDSEYKQVMARWRSLVRAKVRRV